MSYKKTAMMMFLGGFLCLLSPRAQAFNPDRDPSIDPRRTSSARPPDPPKRCTGERTGSFYKEGSKHIGIAIPALVGVDLTLGASVEGRPGFLRGTTRIAADLMLFKQMVKAADVQPELSLQPDGLHGGAKLYVLGRRILSFNTKIGNHFSLPPLPYSFGQAAYTFSVGPIPITLRAEAFGQFGFSMGGNADAATTGGTFEIEPSGGVFGTGSAGIGIPVLMAGLECQITFLELRLPANVTLTADSGGLAWATRGAISGSVLGGLLRVFAKVLFINVVDFTLFDIPAAKMTTELWNASGCVAR